MIAEFDVKRLFPKHSPARLARLFTIARESASVFAPQSASREERGGTVTAQRLSLINGASPPCGLA